MKIFLESYRFVPYGIGMQTTSNSRNTRYQVFAMYNGKRSVIATFRYYSHAYIFRKDIQASDPDGDFWIEDTGDLAPGC